MDRNLLICSKVILKLCLIRRKIIKIKVFKLALANENEYFFDRFTVTEVIDAACLRKNDKSSAQDSIYSEHFKYAHD